MSEPTQNVVVVNANGQQAPRVNHILHLLLSVITMGLWIPVWILIAIFKR